MELRAEFNMADEAFALSPISARAAQPSEEDYAAIHDAFMETSRGRWFLGEYAKRNRNADTRLVLDAVIRLEEGLAAQKQAAEAAGVKEVLSAIRATVSEAQQTVSGSLDGLAFDERMAPIARAVRIIREISWRWRETGADGRICDILDSQAAAIEASAGHISLAEAREATDRAFAAIQARIDECSPIATVDEARRPAEQANVVRFPAPAEDPVEAVAVVRASVGAQPGAESAISTGAAPVEFATGVTSPIADSVSAIELVDEASAEAHDEAVLDLIAAEMSVPQVMDEDPAIEETAIGAQTPEAALDMAGAVSSPVQSDPAAAMLAPVPAPSRMDETGDSIGAAVIASGMLKKPDHPGKDPLAPIRRMSQAERIAFFS